MQTFNQPVDREQNAEERLDSCVRRLHDIGEQLEKLEHERINVEQEAEQMRLVLLEKCANAQQLFSNQQTEPPMDVLADAWRENA